jgi:hypothetical protein
MKRIYHIFINPFLSSGLPNYKKMFRLAYDHFIALESSCEDAVIMNQYLRTKPVFEDFKKKYEANIASQGTSIAGVDAFKKILDVIPKKIRRWEVKILNIIDENSATYVTIFPSGKRHLYRGAQDQIRSKLHAFEIQLGKYPEMQAIYQEVKAFNIKFNKTFSEKGLKTSDTNKTSDELKLSHDEMGLMLYRNLLGLCEHFAPNMHKVEIFFRMQLLRKHKKKTIED